MNDRPTHADDLFDALLEGGIAVAYGSTCEPPVPRGARYQFGDELGRGGTSRVYAGFDRDLQRSVAIKVPHASFVVDGARLHRFLGEARVSSRLQHPGVAPTYDVGQLEDGRPFFVMKRVGGRTFAELLAGRRELADGRARWLSVFGDVARTVAFAHRHGIVHRDLKPANVIVGDHDEVQVVDWGMAKELGHTVHVAGRGAEHPLEPGGSVTGTVLGTPAYMAPEQARGEVDRIGPHSDVFSLGAVLCEILTGEPPYVGEPGEVRERAARADLAVVHDRLRAGSQADALCALALRCLADDRADRPSDAGEVANAVAAHLEAVEDRARAAELTAAVEREARRQAVRVRRRTVVAACAGLVALVVIGFYVAEWWARDARAQGIFEAALEEARARWAQTEGREPGDEAWQRARLALGRVRTLRDAGDVSPAQVAAVVSVARGLDRDFDQAVARREARVADQQLLDELVALRDVDRSSLFAADLSARYAATFAAHGFEPARRDENECAVWIGRCTTGAAVVEHLDHWALVDPQTAFAAHLWRIAMRVDSDPMRTSFREAWIARDLAAVDAMARTTDPRGLAPGTWLAVARSLRGSPGARGLSVTVLEHAHLAYPNDFGIASELGKHLGRDVPPRWEEATRVFAAAMAARPDDPQIRVLLSVALRWLGATERAEHVLDSAWCLVDDRASFYDYLAPTVGEWGGDPRAAAEHAAAWAAEFPESARAHFCLGTLRMRSGAVSAGASQADPSELEAAIPAFERAIELDPSVGNAWGNLGSTLFWLGRDDDAMEVFQRGVEHVPDHSGLLGNLGAAFARRGRFEEAEQVLARAAERDGEDFGVLRQYGHVLTELGRHDAAIATRRRIVRLAPRSVSDLTALAEALWVAGRHLDCIEQITDLLRIDATPDALRILRDVITELPDDRQGPAAEIVERAAQNNLVADTERATAMRADLWELAAGRRVRAGDYAAAAENCSRALRLDSSRGRLITPGLALVALDSAPGGVRALTAALASIPPPSHPEAAALLAVGRASALAGGGSPDEAIDLLVAHLASFDGIPFAHGFLGHHLRGAGRYQEALTHYERARELSGNPQFLADHADLCAREIAAASREPNRPGASSEPRDCWARARVNLQRGQLEPAAKDFVDLLDGAPQLASSPSFRFDVARCAAAAVAAGDENAWPFARRSLLSVADLLRVALDRGASPGALTSNASTLLLSSTFAAVRDPARRAALPPAVQAQWNEIWSDLDLIVSDLVRCLLP